MGGATVKIMVVDDDVFVREMLSSILEAAGYEVLVAEDGLDALEKYKADREVQLIVSDINMPRMDGVQLIHALRQERLEVPIIMVTSVNSISVAVDALSSGAIDYVLKDEGIQDTIEITIKRALEKHQLKLDHPGQSGPWVDVSKGDWIDGGARLSGGVCRQSGADAGTHFHHREDSGHCSGGIGRQPDRFGNRDRGVPPGGRVE